MFLRINGIAKLADSHNAAKFRLQDNINDSTREIAFFLSTPELVSDHSA